LIIIDKEIPFGYSEIEGTVEVQMKNPIVFHSDVDTSKYIAQAPIPPFVDIILKNSKISEEEFPRIIQLVSEYRNDPRLVEMVRKAGDASAKVGYLVDYGQSPETILATLREIAQPHVERLKKLPEPVRMTIDTLLSINKMPVGHDIYGIPALLELDKMQFEMVHDLRQIMPGRILAEEFYQANVNALKCIDEDWPRLQKKRIPYWPDILSIPKTASMQYEPVFEHHQLKYIYETCVIVQPPWLQEFEKFIPRVLHRPLEEKEIVPATGSADWLIREIGKVGRHITRALLELIREHLEEEKIALEAKNYEEINRQAQEVLQEYIRSKP
jgi:hypothetical protein